jgi:hypothetical protein
VRRLAGGVDDLGHALADVPAGVQDREAVQVADLAALQALRGGLRGQRTVGDGRENRFQPI